MLAEVRVCTLSESQDLEHSDFSENYDTTRVNSFRLVQFSRVFLLRKRDCLLWKSLADHLFAPLLSLVSSRGASSLLFYW